jgi:hypothetical protein
MGFEGHEMTVLLHKVLQASIGMLASLIVMSSLAHAGWRPITELGLGEAGKYAVFMLGKPSTETVGDPKLDLASVTVCGDVAVGPWSQFDFQGPSTINGDLYLDKTIPGGNILSNVGTLNGLRYWDKDLSPAVAAAINASQMNAARKATQMFGPLVSSLTIAGNGGLNVISIRSIDYAKSALTSPLELTLQGGPNDIFIVNISGKLALGHGASIKSPDPSRVLINVLPGLTPISMSPGSYLGGTLLAVDRKMGPISGTTGPVIGAQLREISLLGGAKVSPPDPALVPVAVIEGSHAVITGQTVYLDGSKSTSPTQCPLVYTWSFVTRPAGSTAAFLPSAQVDKPYFTADKSGDYLVQLVVRDQLDKVSDPARFIITATDPGSEADLDLRISDAPDPVGVRSTLTYTMTVENKGPGAVSGVNLKASLIGRMDGLPIADHSACGITPGEVTCNLGALDIGAKHVVRISVKPIKVGNFYLRGTASAPGQLDPFLGNNVWEEITKVVQPSQLK